MKIKHILLTLTLFLLLLAAPAAAAGGSGTADNPYVIETPQELQSIQNDLSAHYILGADLNMAGFEFTPIGISSAPFIGTLDGKGHTISNPSTALFQSTRGCLIKNIIITNGTYTSAGNEGAVVCRVAEGSRPHTTIQNIIVDSCTFTSTGQNKGGIIGSAPGEVLITNCSVINTYIYCTAGQVGGIAGFLGYNTNGSVISCTVDNCIINGGANVGGIAGYVGGASTSSGKIGIAQDCSVTNTIITASSYVGGVAGVIGYLTSSATGSATGNIIDSNVSNCTISARTNYAGGIAGARLSYGEIINCDISDSTVLSPTTAAGICSYFR